MQEERIKPDFAQFYMASSSLMSRRKNKIVLCGWCFVGYVWAEGGTVTPPACTKTSSSILFHVFSFGTQLNDVFYIQADAMRNLPSALQLTTLMRSFILTIYLTILGIGVLKICSALTRAYDLTLQWKWNKLLNKLNVNPAVYIPNTAQMGILWTDTVFQFSVQVSNTQKWVSDRILI